MNKRRLHHLLNTLRKIRPMYFVILILASASISVLALRQNNLRSVELRNVVIATDEKNGDVETALRNLREHIHSHMHSELAGIKPSVQLTHRYERLTAAETSKVTAANSQLYTTAQAECERQIPTGRSLNRIDCIQDYVTSRGGAIEQPVNESLYKFDFVAPIWSPDLAGWSVLVTAVLILSFGIRMAVYVWVRYNLRHHL